MLFGSSADVRTPVTQTQARRIAEPINSVLTMQNKVLPLHHVTQFTGCVLERTSGKDVVSADSYTEDFNLTMFV